MGRIAAIDYGLKRIGIAISDERKIMALPLTTVQGGLTAVVAALLPRKKEIESIVIGLPLLMNGARSDMSSSVEKFAHLLEAALEIPVILLDERLSSKHADASLRELSLNRKERTEKMDQVAAAHLLQSYLEQNRNNN